MRIDVDESVVNNSLTLRLLVIIPVFDIYPRRSEKIRPVVPHILRGATLAVLEVQSDIGRDFDGFAIADSWSESPRRENPDGFVVQVFAVGAVDQ